MAHDAFGLCALRRSDIALANPPLPVRIFEVGSHPWGVGVLKKYCSLVIAFCMLMGCAGVSPKKFSPVTVASAYVLSEDVTYIASKANAFHPDIVNGLAKGRYVAIFEDRSYVYYVGEGDCVLPFKDRGGIAIAKDGSTPRLWVYIRDSSDAIYEQGGGVIISQLSKLEAGRIRIFNTVVGPELISLLKLEETGP